MHAVHVLPALVIMLSSACRIGKTGGDAAILSDHLFRSVRLENMMYDVMGEGIQYQEWHDGSFKLTGEFAWKPLELEGKTQTLRMQHYLIIPNAPWIGKDGASSYMLTPDGKGEKVGEYEWVDLKLASGGVSKLWMHRSITTNGKWIGRDGGLVYEQGPNGAGLQIGTLEYRDVKLEDGRLAKKIVMTKGVGKDAVWEGEVDNVTYRETPSGVTVPVQVWEYRKIKLQDGRETFLLMARPVKGGTWVGVRDGSPA